MTTQSTSADRHRFGKKTKIALVLSITITLLISSSAAILSSSVIINSYGGIGNDYSLETQLQSFHSGRGIGGVLDGLYSESNIRFCRMQLFAEIDNTATNPDDVLIPNGLDLRNDDYSEGGVNYVNLKRNIAYVLDRGMIPDVGLWITNLDPLESRQELEAYDDPNASGAGHPMANAAGYRLFLESLNAWLIANYPSNGYIIWEPCWEFNLYPWTNWGGAGGNRYWAIIPEDYENAMRTIRGVLDGLSDRRIYLVSHIIPWDADSWLARGKLRITDDNIGYLRGIQYVDFLTISSYIEKGNWADGVDSATGGLTGHGTGRTYMQWYFTNVVQQIATDPDISVNGTRFLGMNEYNIGGIEEGSPGNMDAFITYTYTVLVPQYFNYFKMILWWVPFNTQQEWNVWKNLATQYDGWHP